MDRSFLFRATTAAAFLVVSDAVAQPYTIAQPEAAYYSAEVFLPAPDPLTYETETASTAVVTPEPAEIPETASTLFVATDADFVLAVVDELHTLYDICTEIDAGLAQTGQGCTGAVVEVGLDLLTPFTPGDEEPKEDPDLFKIKLIGTYEAFLPNVIPNGAYQGPLENLAKYLTDPSDKVKKAAKALLTKLLKGAATGKTTKEYLQELVDGKALDKDQKAAVKELIK